MTEHVAEQPCILVGEDDQRTVRVIRRTLSDRFRLLWAHDGEQLMVLASTEPRPDLVVLDAHLADDGYALSRRLKASEATKDVPVLMLRNARAKEAPLEVFACGAEDYVAKPIDEPTLLARVAIHLELNRLRELTSSALALDALTEVADRRGVEEHLETEWGRAAREATPLSFILLRIDHFDALLSSLGPDAGDDCLRKVAEELTSTVRRPMDFLGRYNTDTFAVVLPVTEAHGASYLAERMCEQVEFLEIQNPGAPAAQHVTMSAGVATLLPFPGSAPTPLVEAAQEGVELAFQAGGNGVRTVEPVVN